MSASCRLDALMGDAVAALEAFERRRAALHEALRGAHFSYSVAQREMDRAGLLLGWPAVPAEEEREKEREKERDPVLWFAAAPPPSLRECAEKFRAVVAAVASAAEAQELAVEAAAAYRTAADASES